MGETNRLEQEKVELTEELTLALHARLFQHGKTLVLKHRQLVQTDDYGNFVPDKFLKERDYFIKTVLTKDISVPMWEFMFPEKDPTTLFHEAYSIYVNAVHDWTTPLLGVDSNTLPLEFEQHCCDVLQREGWQARTTVGSGDQGIDIIALWNRKKLVVQCKLYSKPVGNAAVQEIIAGRAFERAEYAVVVSNMPYTPSAITLAATAGVLLLDHSELPDLHVRLGLAHGVSPQAERARLDAVDQRPTIRNSIARPINEVLQQAEILLAEWISTAASCESDPLYDQAVEVVIRHRRASISLVQRHLRIGYARAARLLQQMEDAGMVSTMSPHGSREILVPAHMSIQAAAPAETEYPPLSQVLPGPNKKRSRPWIRIALLFATVLLLLVWALSSSHA